MAPLRWEESTLQTYHEGDIIMREILTQLHQGTHWRVQAMCGVILRVYVCPGIYTLVKQITEGCLICRKVNKEALRGNF
jgi:hypothetical protein